MHYARPFPHCQQRPPKVGQLAPKGEITEERPLAEEEVTLRNKHFDGVQLPCKVAADMADWLARGSLPAELAENPLEIEAVGNPPSDRRAEGVGHRLEAVRVKPAVIEPCEIKRFVRPIFQRMAEAAPPRLGRDNRGLREAVFERVGDVRRIDDQGAFKCKRRDLSDLAPADLAHPAKRIDRGEIDLFVAQDRPHLHAKG